MIEQSQEAATGSIPAGAQDNNLHVRDGAHDLASKWASWRLLLILTSKTRTKTVVSE
jgi:hypothetical protein